jgi:hypothetical protein
MTSKEIIALEDSNTGCINLYKKGCSGVPMSVPPTPSAHGSIRSRP